MIFFHKIFTLTGWVVWAFLFCWILATFFALIGKIWGGCIDGTTALIKTYKLSDRIEILENEMREMKLSIAALAMRKQSLDTECNPNT